MCEPYNCVRCAQHSSAFGLLLGETRLRAAHVTSYNFTTSQRIYLSLVMKSLKWIYLGVIPTWKTLMALVGLSKLQYCAFPHALEVIPALHDLTVLLTLTVAGRSMSSQASIVAGCTEEAAVLATCSTAVRCAAMAS